MKKLSIVLVTIVLCCSAFLFTGCDQSKTAENNSVIPDQYDLANVEVGTKLPTLHPANFSYQYQKDDKTYTFHIDDFSAELCEKRPIKEGDVITDDNFRPYTIKLSISGTTDPLLAGKKFAAYFANYFLRTYVSLTILPDGTFSGTNSVTVLGYSPICFEKIS